jgi:hypothetical protein
MVFVESPTLVCQNGSWILTSDPSLTASHTCENNTYQYRHSSFRKRLCSTSSWAAVTVKAHRSSRMSLRIMTLSSTFSTRSATFSCGLMSIPKFHLRKQSLKQSSRYWFELYQRWPWRQNRSSTGDLVG